MTLQEFQTAKELVDDHGQVWPVLRFDHEASTPTILAHDPTTNHDIPLCVAAPFVCHGDTMCPHSAFTQTTIES